MKTKKIVHTRPTWDEYFMQLATVVMTRSDCIRRSVGAILVRDRRIIATGYNGTPHGLPNCTENGCERCLKREQGKIRSGEQEELCICIHAEQNVIIQAALHGVSTQGSTLYSTTSPCNQCAKLLINAGIVRCVVRGDDKYKGSERLFKASGIISVTLS